MGAARQGIDALAQRMRSNVLLYSVVEHRALAVPLARRSGAHVRQRHKVHAALVNYGVELCQKMFLGMIMYFKNGAFDNGTETLFLPLCSVTARCMRSGWNRPTRR